MFSLQLPKRDERGFTLIELLVVIIIIGILAAIAIPLFLDQRKLAVDASVKSDVRNTATQVQTWQATNQGVIATDVVDYKSKGGSVSQSANDTVGVSVATDGSYLVCGYAGTAAKQYTASSAAYVYDSTSGKFGLGSCTGGIVGGGSPAPSTSTPAAPVGGVSNGTYTSTLESGDTTTSMWSLSDTGSLASTTQNHTPGGSQSIYLVNAQGNSNAQFSPNPNLTIGKTYTVSVWVYNVGAQRVGLYVYGDPYGTGTYTSRTFSTKSGQWEQLTLPLSVTGNQAFVRVISGVGQTTSFYVDDLTISPN